MYTYTNTTQRALERGQRRGWTKEEHRKGKQGWIQGIKHAHTNITDEEIRECNKGMCVCVSVYHSLSWVELLICMSVVDNCLSASSQLSYHHPPHNAGLTHPHAIHSSVTHCYKSLNTHTIIAVDVIIMVPLLVE